MIRVLPTPTFSLTATGLFSLALWRLGLPYADLVAFGAFALAGFGGVALAFGTFAQRRSAAWDWRVVGRALLSGDRRFWTGLAGHVPMLLAALALAFYWRRKRGS